MDEAEWLAATDPGPMLEALRGKVSDRKLRLFVCACCRHVLQGVPNRSGEAAALKAEQFSEGLATQDELRAAARTLDEDNSDNSSVLLPFHFACDMESTAHRVAWFTAAHAADALAAASYEEHSLGVHIRWTPTWATARAVQASLLRDIIGNPFRSRPVLAPSLLAWRDGLLVRLAESVYENRVLPSGHFDRDRVAVLADALEDAGCQDAQILSHLRGEGPHVRGCWCVDLFLGKG
jgi:hypothetical protein